MRVRDLIHFLENLPPMAEVWVAHQPNHPLSFPVQEEIAVSNDESRIYLAQDPLKRGEYLEEGISTQICWEE